MPSVKQAQLLLSYRPNSMLCRICHKHAFLVVFAFRAWVSTTLCLMEVYMFDDADTRMHQKLHILPLLLRITASSLQMLTRHVKAS